MIFTRKEYWLYIVYVNIDADYYTWHVFRYFEQRRFEKKKKKTIPENDWENYVFLRNNFIKILLPPMPRIKILIWIKMLLFY